MARLHSIKVHIHNAFIHTHVVIHLWTEWRADQTLLRPCTRWHIKDFVCCWSSRKEGERLIPVARKSRTNIITALTYSRHTHTHIFLWTHAIQLLSTLARLMKQRNMFSARNPEGALDTFLSPLSMATAERTTLTGSHFHIKFSMSSANIIRKRLCDTRDESLIQIRNNNGPRIHPWGTPHISLALFE